MLCFKRFFLSFVVLASVVLPLQAEDITSCLEEGKKHFADKNYSQSKSAFQRCIKLDPKNMDAQLSLAGVQLTEEDLNGAEKTFRNALSQMKRTSPYLSYTYSMLGDIALKQQKNDEALSWYSKSLEVNKANVNSLIGKGLIIENQGDRKTASSFYRSALAVEPLNLIARKRLINLEPYYFTDEEILAALKQRYATKPDTAVLNDEERKLFKQIHRAEQRRGIDYLKGKFNKIPTDYTVTINKNTPFERQMLTLAGYRVLTNSLAQDAINVFQRVGVPMKDMFDLRDMHGNAVFAKDTTLTDSGFRVYRQALQNKKAFLLPNEEVPPSKALLQQVEQTVEYLQDVGYIEIAKSELKVIQRKTNCSEKTLKDELGLYVIPITKSTRRYFISAEQTDDAKKNLPYYYLMEEHAKTNPNIEVPENSLARLYWYHGRTVCGEDGNLDD